MKHIVHVMPANISHNSYTTKDDYRPESMIRLMDDNGNLTDKAVLAYGVKFKGEVELKSGYGNDVLPETQTRVWLEGEIESSSIDVVSTEEVSVLLARSGEARVAERIRAVDR